MGEFLENCCCSCLESYGTINLCGRIFRGGVESYSTAMRLGPRVSILDRQGTLLARLGEYPFGDEAGRFYAPHGVATDSKGDIYVAEVSYAEYGRLLKPPRELRSMRKLIKRV